MSDHDHDGHADAAKPDTTPPRNELIFVIVLGSVATLFGLKFVFDSYLDREVRLTHSEHNTGGVSADALAEYREEAAATLAGGAMTIDEAMSQLGDRGRAAFVQIRPAPSDTSRAALEGWASLPVAPPAAAPSPSRTPYILSVDHLPPPDPEADALEAAADLAPAVPPTDAVVPDAPL